MRIWIQKFGGSSLSSAAARDHAIKHLKHALAAEVRLVVVVSAMGRLGDPYATDTLLKLIDTASHLASREHDLLLSCGELISAVVFCEQVRRAGIDAQVLTGAQAGILTDEQHGNARVHSVQPDRILQCLEAGQVVIVTGFQGINRFGDITTLGRGGSDTTAAALGVALNAEYVDIFTDVEGILTADPKIVEDARKISEVTYSEICNMAYNGAKVIHSRAVEMVMHANIPLRIRSTFSDQSGTLVTQRRRGSAATILRDQEVTGITHRSGISQIKVFASENEYLLHVRVFQAMAKCQINVDFINVNPSEVVYTVFSQDLEQAIDVLRELGCKTHIQADCAKVAIIGGGINGVPGIVARIVEALAAEEIAILQTADSNTTIWVLVEANAMEQAVRALHRKFLMQNIDNV